MHVIEEKKNCTHIYGCVTGMTSFFDPFFSIHYESTFSDLAGIRSPTCVWSNRYRTLRRSAGNRNRSSGRQPYASFASLCVSHLFLLQIFSIFWMWLMLLATYRLGTQTTTFNSSCTRWVCQEQDSYLTASLQVILVSTSSCYLTEYSHACKPVLLWNQTLNGSEQLRSQQCYKCSAYFQLVCDWKCCALGLCRKVRSLRSE